MLALLLSGCFLDTKACDTMAVASVNVTVVDADGAAVPGAVVSWREDGGDWSACDGVGDTWACGWEVSGDLEIQVEADGWETQVVPVSIVEGECHVEPQSITVTLEPIACTDEARASVMATVTGSSGEELTGVEVMWAPIEGDVERRPCEDQDGSWVCGWEEAGDLEIYATADGHGPETQIVTVPMTDDGCHVVTQSVDFALDWLPD